MLNPLFPSDEQQDDTDKQGLDPFRSISHRQGKTIKPPRHRDLNPAADLIRDKIARLYAHEPTAKQEIREAKTEPVAQRSKHQQFMLELSRSGKGLAEIQTAWHNYYVNLPETEKHEVWQEFYEANSHGNSHYGNFVQQQAPAQPEPTPTPTPAKHDDGMVVAEHEVEPPKPKHAKPTKLAIDRRSVAEIKRQLQQRVNAGGKLTAKHHLQSLLFGLGVGVLVVVITLFGFFNEYLIAPFIQPSRTVSATPLIIGTDSVAPTSTPEVIIPKINAEIPLNFSITTINEDQIENGLEDGVVHYPTTVLPGQQGNTAFFGHSSNNIFNPGHYKFAFALLHDLVPGDTFYLTYGGKVYGYQVYDKQIVDPNDVGVLNNVPGKVATATLITCDPPGTSLHRLVVWGEQVSPSPSANTVGDNTSSSLTNGAQLPSNGPSLWDRLVGGITGLF